MRVCQYCGTVCDSLDRYNAHIDMCRHISLICLCANCTQVSPRINHHRCPYCMHQLPTNLHYEIHRMECDSANSEISSRVQNNLTSNNVINESESTSSSRSLETNNTSQNEPSSTNSGFELNGVVSDYEEREQLSQRPMSLGTQVRRTRPVYSELINGIPTTPSPNTAVLTEEEIFTGISNTTTNNVVSTNVVNESNEEYQLSDDSIDEHILNINVEELYALLQQNNQLWGVDGSSTSREPIPSTSREPIPSTSREPIPSTSREPAPSTNGTTNRANVACPSCGHGYKSPKLLARHRRRGCLATANPNQCAGCYKVVDNIRAHQNRCKKYKTKLERTKLKRDGSTQTCPDAKCLDKMIQTDDNDSSRYTCCVCMDDEISVIFLPCLHYVCQTCSSRIPKHCARCRAYIIEKRHMYL